MQTIDSLPPGQLPQSVATIGFFDGVHCGHRFLLDQVKSIAHELGLSSALVTFPIHPRRVLHADFQPQLLSTPEEKLERLQKVDIEYCFWLPFTTELAALSAYQFMKFLRDNYNIRSLVIGHDHRFGHNRSEQFEDYVAHGEALGIKIIQAERYDSTNEETNSSGSSSASSLASSSKSSLANPLGSSLTNPSDTSSGSSLANSSVSSSAIRRLLLEGNVEKAATFLGYPYTLSGLVVSGFKMGTKIGFPTANLAETGEHKLIPASGVYAVRVWVGEDKVGEEAYMGMMNVGTRPTLNNGSEQSLEVHLIDFSGNLYDSSIRVEFIAYLRAEQKFASLQALQEQLAKDRLAVIERFT